MGCESLVNTSVSTYTGGVQNSVSRVSQMIPSLNRKLVFVVQFSKNRSFSCCPGIFIFSDVENIKEDDHADTVSASHVIKKKTLQIAWALFFLKEITVNVHRFPVT